MGFRFYKSYRLGKHTRLNLSTRGIRVSTGTKNIRTTVGPRGARVSASIPGTGLSYQANFGSKESHPAHKQPASGSSPLIGCVAAVLAVTLLLLSAFSIVYFLFNYLL